MKILSFMSKVVPKDVARTKQSLCASIKSGWNVGKRYSQINNKGLAADMYIRGKAISHNVKLTKNDIPAVAAVAALPIPIPGAMFVGYGFGHVVKGAVNVFGKIAK